MSNSSYLITDEKKIVLIWSPKCACTSLKEGFIRNVCEIADNKNVRILAKGKRKVNYSGIPKNYFIYWGIRNPFDRIVSCYFNKFILYANNRLNENNLEDFSESLLKQIGINYNDLTFNKMLYGIQKLKSKKRINHHFDNQVNINNYNKIKNHHNLFVFDINEIPEILKIGVKKNVTKKSKSMLIKDLCNTKAKDIDINALLKENFANSENLVREIYKQDYQIFKKHNIIY